MKDDKYIMYHYISMVLRASKNYVKHSEELLEPMRIFHLV